MKNAIIQKLVLLWVVTILAACVSAKTIYVDSNGTGDYPTIRDAINAAKDGDEIVLTDGEYKLQRYGYIYLYRSITVRSENGPENCIINCNGSQQQWEHKGAFCIYSDATIAGITIINGCEYQGAILCEYASAVSIK